MSHLLAFLLVVSILGVQLGGLILYWSVLPWWLCVNMIISLVGLFVSAIDAITDCE